LGIDRASRMRLSFHGSRHALLDYRRAAASGQTNYRGDFGKRIGGSRAGSAGRRYAGGRNLSGNTTTLIALRSTRDGTIIPPNPASRAARPIACVSASRPDACSVSQSVAKSNSRVTCNRRRTLAWVRSSNDVTSVSKGTTIQVSGLDSLADRAGAIPKCFIPANAPAADVGASMLP
jgi:hypothetical protein